VSSQLRVCDVLMVKILNKCILSSLVYSLVYRQRYISIHRYLDFLHEIEIQIVQKYGYLIG